MLGKGLVVYSQYPDGIEPFLSSILAWLAWAGPVFESVSYIRIVIIGS